MQSDERSFFGALRVAGHGTVTARLGRASTSADISRRLTGRHSAAHTAPARMLCSSCAAAVEGAILPLARFLSFWDHWVRDLEAGRGEG